MNEIFENKGKELTGKLLALALLMFISWVATFSVWGVIGERQNYQETVSAEIAQQWSGSQTIAGPVLTIPIEKSYVSSTGERTIDMDTINLLPKSLVYESDMKTELRTRGVYETPVYTTAIKGSGSFDISDIGLETSADTKILWEKAVLSIHISDTRGITSMFDLTWNDAKYALLPSSEFFTLDTNGVHTNVAMHKDLQTYTFGFELPLRGSREIAFLPLGESTEIHMQSDWSAPSFQGGFLPIEREFTENGFSAKWNITSFGKNIPQFWYSDTGIITAETLLSKTFGVGLYQEVNFYTMVDRATKYSILFITLTFLTFFMYEILAGLRIHAMQYLLVGLAIALFYLLLLSFAEIIGFLPAYLVSTVATTALISGYCISILKVKKRVLSIVFLLIALYAYLYILLQLEEFSLLFGSLLLFGVLATVMYITRNLNWYSLTKNK